MQRQQTEKKCSASSVKEQNMVAPMSPSCSSFFIALRTNFFACQDLENIYLCCASSHFCTEAETERLRSDSRESFSCRQSLMIIFGRDLSQV